MITKYEYYCCNTGWIFGFEGLKLIQFDIMSEILLQNMKE